MSIIQGGVSTGGGGASSNYSGGTREGAKSGTSESIDGDVFERIVIPLCVRSSFLHVCVLCVSIKCQQCRLYDDSHSHDREHVQRKNLSNCGSICH